MGFYESKCKKNYCPTAQKPLILLGFSKSSISPLVPSQNNPNQVFLVVDGFGLFVYFEKCDGSERERIIYEKLNNRHKSSRKKTTFKNQEISRNVHRYLIIMFCPTILMISFLINCLGIIMWKQKTKKLLNCFLIL